MFSFNDMLFAQNLRNEGLERVLTLIVDKLNANATVTSGLLSMRGQVVFAVKTGLDGKLDAMRNVYNSLIDEIEGNLRAQEWESTSIPYLFIPNKFYSYIYF